MNKILIMLLAIVVSFKANAIDNLVDELEATEMNIMSLQDKLMNNEESNIEEEEDSDYSEEYSEDDSNEDEEDDSESDEDEDEDDN